jgi:hypothetical protein
MVADPPVADGAVVPVVDSPVVAGAVVTVVATPVVAGGAVTVDTAEMVDTVAGTPVADMAVVTTKVRAGES